MATALRLGLLLDGASLKGWHSSIITQITQENEADFKLRIKNTEDKIEKIVEQFRK